MTPDVPQTSTSTLTSTPTPTYTPPHRESTLNWKALVIIVIVILILTGTVIAVPRFINTNTENRSKATDYDTSIANNSNSSDSSDRPSATPTSRSNRPTPSPPANNANLTTSSTPISLQLAYDGGNSISINKQSLNFNDSSNAPILTIDPTSSFPVSIDQPTKISQQLSLTKLLSCPVLKTDSTGRLICGSVQSVGSTTFVNMTSSGHPDTSSQDSVSNSGGTVIQGFNLDTYGHITSAASTNLDSRYLQGNQTITLFGPVTGSGTVSIVTSIGATTISDTQLVYKTGQHLTTTSTPTFAGIDISTLTIKGQSGLNGQVLVSSGPGLSPAWTTVSGLIPYTAGTGLTLVGNEFQHLDSSSQADTANSDGTVIQNITFDQFGHVTGASSLSLDSRYEAPLTFNNGLLRSGNSIGLGGPLSANTQLDLNNFNLAFVGSGSVGVGTTDTTYPFNVNGSINITGQYLINGIPLSIGGSGNSYWQAANGSNINYGLGNVGIGTTAPESKLTIVGSEDSTQLVVKANATQSNSNPLITLKNANGDVLLSLHSDSANNTFLGYSAGKFNTVTGNGGEGQFNTFIGSNAGLNNSTGGYNVSIGAGALNSNTIGSGNVAVGIDALYRNDANNNSAFGTRALYNNYSGVENSAFGLDSLLNNSGGGGNSAYGSQSLRNNNNGNSNSAFGIRALYSNYDGSENNAFGRDALYNNVNGANNNAFGSDALRVNNNGNNNGAFGFHALYSNFDGSENNAFGRDALYNNVNGVNNNAFGSEALRINNNGNNNSAFGRNALFSNYDGSENNAFGRDALYANVNGANNNAFGSEAMRVNNNGINNNAFGRNALYSNYDGSENSAFGRDVLYNNINGGNNSAFGSEAMRNSTNGNNNSAFGRNALYSNFEGSNNVAIGLDSLHDNYNGAENVAVGKDALRTNTNGNDNSAVGSEALLSNIEGGWNSAFGRQSLYSNTSGENNNAIGYQSLYSNVNGSGNIAIGSFALHGSTNGNDNTALGNMAGAYQTDGSTPLEIFDRSVYIGYNAMGRENDDNTIVIGSEAASLGPDSVVLGNDSITTTALKGNVGIGTTAPQYKLDINGDLNVGTSATFANKTITLFNQNDVGYAPTLGFNDSWNNPNKYFAKIQGLTQSGGAGILTFSTKIDDNNPATDAEERMRIDTAGNVGIGTPSPIYKLHVNGNQFISANLNIGGSDSLGTPMALYAQNNDTYNLEPFSRGARIINNVNVDDLVANGMEIPSDVPRTSFGLSTRDDFYGNGGHKRSYGIFSVAGNMADGTIEESVGIGVQIENRGSGTIENVYGLKIYAPYDSGTINNTWGVFAMSGDNYFSGNVGIGTSTVDYPLTVNGEPAANGYTAFTNYSDSRLKTSINTLPTGYLDKILSLKPSTFKYNDLTGYDSATKSRTITGFIAQEIQTIFPDMVGHVNIGGTDYLDTNLSALPIYTVKALQELNGQLTDLSMTPDGQVFVNYNTSESVLSSLGYDGSKNEIESAVYSNQINTGLVKTINLTAKNIIAEVTKSKVVKTDTITPLDDVTDTITVSGNLVATKIGASEASFSTVYADKILNQDGNIADIMTQKISDLRSEIQNTISSIGVTAAPSTPSALVADSTGWNYNVGTSQLEVTANMSLTSNLVVGAKLAVLGDTQLANAFITGTFTAGEVAIKENFIETTATALFIQPSGMGSVNIMNNTLVIADNGEVTVTGNLAVSGKITASEASVSGSLFARLITADEASFSGKLIAKSIESQSVKILGAEASSSALTVADPAPTAAIIKTSATAGKITLPYGQTEVVVYNNKISSDSLVYLTPNDDTNNQTVYIKAKMVDTQNQTYFVVGTKLPITKPDTALADKTGIDINWWIIN